MVAFARRWLFIAGATLVLAVITVNSAVRFVSGSGPFLLDPRSMREKVTALWLYARHRPGCFFRGDGDLERLARTAARRHGVDPALLAAVVEVESGTVAHRISWRGACGPAQLLPSTARLLGVVDPFDPPTALDGAARLLRENLDHFHNRALAVAAYNAGPGAVHGTIPVNGETEFYVPRVLAAWKRRYSVHAAAFAK